MTPSIEIDGGSRHAAKSACSKVRLTAVSSRTLSRKHRGTDRKAQAPRARLARGWHGVQCRVGRWARRQVGVQNSQFARQFDRNRWVLPSGTHSSNDSSSGNVGLAVRKTASLHDGSSEHDGFAVKTGHFAWQFERKPSVLPSEAVMVRGVLGYPRVYGRG